MKIITKKETEGSPLFSGGRSNGLVCIPELYKNSWIEDCDSKIKDWMSVEKPDRKKWGLYIYGSCGTGKTYALYALFRNCILQDFPCRIKNTVELLRLFKQDFKNNEDNFEDYLEYKGLLFIDDIGVEKNTEFVDETLYHLINIRCEKMLPTFFTSNLSIKELSQKNGDRIASRIVGMCEIVKLEGKDKRIG